MKTVCKKLLSLMLVAMLLVSAVPFQALAAEVETTAESTETTAAVTETTAATEAVEAAAETTEAAAETEAATEAATEAPAAEGTATQPTVKSVGDTRTVKYVVDGHVFAETTVLIGSKLLYVPTAAQVLEAYADYNGNYNGKQFNGFSIDGFGGFDPYTTNVVDSMVSADGIVYINAKVGNQKSNIILVTNGGTVSNNSYSVTIGEPYGNLPTPTREHYTFKYWYKTVNGSEVPVNGETIVTSNDLLCAKWELNKYTVWFERYDGTQWVGVENYQVSALGTLTTANGFPTEAEIASNYALSGYSIVGWEIGESDSAFTPGVTLVTKEIVVRPRYQGTVTLMANNPNNYTSNSTKSITVEIGEPVPSLPNPGARDGYTFVDWVAADESTVISTKENLSKVSAHPNYYPSLGSTFYARWTESTVVYLYIHTNGNTQTATKIVPYYEAPTSGAFDMSLINMYSIFSEYGKYDDEGDAAYGWYDATQWKNYCAGTAANSATLYYNIKDNNYIEFHIMLVDNGNNSVTNNYNTNSSTADSSNPTTGDYIFMAVIVMAVSAAALALIFFMKKRKASK